MTKFIEKPNSPQSKVTLCCVAINCLSIKKALNDLSIEVIDCQENNNVDNPLKNHTDMSICHLGNNEIVCENNLYKLNEELKKHNFNVINSEKSVYSPYPDDIALNCLICNKTIFGKLKFTDNAILNHCKAKGLNTINVNQGYVKCSTLIVNEHSVITSDVGLAQTYQKNGLEVLLISTGEIDLPGYDYGFIGGCSGLIDKNLLAFTGDVTLHSNWRKIKAFLLERQVNYICLSSEKLLDIGSIIPLKEKSANGD